MHLTRSNLVWHALLAFACLLGSVAVKPAVKAAVPPVDSPVPAPLDPAGLRSLGPMLPEVRSTQAELPQAARTDSIALNATILQNMANYHIAGLAGCVVKDGQTVWHHPYGLADVDQGIDVTDTKLFMLASISKTFVATAVMQLWEDGLLNLDGDINDYLPFPVVNPSYPDVPITMRMILAHVSSIARNDGGWLPLITWGVDCPIPLGEFLEDWLVPGGIYYDPSNYKPYAPGTGGEYSNIAFSLAGYIVEQVSGQSFELYCQEHIFAPLEMYEASWFLAELNPKHIAIPTAYTDGDYVPYGHPGIPVYPAGQLRTSSLQLARHLIAFIQGGQIEGVRILQPATVEMMRTVQYPGILVLGLEFGLGWYRIDTDGEYLWGHTGGFYGVATYMFCDPVEGYGYLFLTNADHTSGHSNINDAMHDFARNLPSSSSVGSDWLEEGQVMLVQGFPNPFNRSTTISFTLPEVMPVRLSIHDVQGCRVVTLCDDIMPPGAHSYLWNGTDHVGHRTGSGVYYYRLRAGSRCETRTLTVLN